MGKGRYVRDEQINKPEDFVAFIMNDYLSKNGFKQKQVKGEWVWQEGVGMLTIPKFLKYSYENGILHLETWIKTAWLPGVYGKDQDLEGFTAAVPKQSYRKEIQTLVDVLYQPIPENNTYGLDENGNTVNTPIQVQTYDTKNKAITGFICSLVSLVAMLLNIYLGIILACIGIVNSKKGMTSSKKGLATAGFVIGIIAIVLCIIIGILAIIGTVLLA